MEQLKKTAARIKHPKDAEKIARLPRQTLRERQLYDLEMLLGGGFAPLEGFLNEKDYHGVVEHMRLADGTLWPMPIVLDISRERSEELGIEIGGGATEKEIILTDPFGNPLAFMKIESAYAPDKLNEAKKVYGTTDVAHPGVRHLLHDTKEIYLGGTLTLIQFPIHYDFNEYRKTAAELRHELKKIKAGREKNGQGSKVIAFQTRNPMHRAHFHLVESLSEANGAHALIHPVVGPTKEGDIDYKTRVRTYMALHKAHIPGATLALLPLAMRMAGPREALWHALIRKNYGATHFIVGRDHAAPGKGSDGKNFYGPYDAQELTREYQAELGIIIVPSEELVYVKEIDGYLPASKVDPEHTTLSISGTKFRELLRAGEPIPEWFSFPEVIEVLKASVAGDKAEYEGEYKEGQKGKVILFTGLSGAGKSTIAGHLKVHLEENLKKTVTYLDGDVVRETLSKGLGFSKEDRIENIRRIGFVAAEVARHGGIAIISAIAPYREARTYVREQTEKNGGAFYEIFVRAKLETLKARDVKGLYMKSELGLLKGLSGVDSEYEEPEAPHAVIDTDSEPVDASVRKILQSLAFEK